LAITFTYTESTNKVVVTGGTAGTAAHFSDFVTADRAGTDTDLLVAGSPASDLALTYAVRPVEDLAILVKCVVANKTAEADFIFITGTDFAGNAQTESIDVTAGDGSYTTTKYWASITTLDCSDNANGGGTVWADGDLSVTQDIWGVIWDYGNGQYYIAANFQVGDGSTTTYFTEAQTAWAWSASNSYTVPMIDINGVFDVTANATFQMGIKIDVDTTSRGGVLVVHDTSTTNISGSILLYGSIFVNGKHSATTAYVFASGSTFEAINSQIGTKIIASGATLVRIRHCMFAAYLFTLLQDPGNATTVDTYDISLYSLGDANVAAAVILSVSSTAEGLLITNVAHAFRIVAGTHTVVNSTFDDTALVGDAAGRILYNAKTVNIHVSDRDGVNLQNVVVDCEDQYGTACWTAGTITTDAGGDIAEQEVNYKKYEGPTPMTTTTYSPHKFTISKAGYKTFVLDNITVDSVVDWYFELPDIDINEMQEESFLISQVETYVEEDEA
jgi:hypothetical protein